LVVTRWHDDFANLQRVPKGWNLNIEGAYKSKRGLISEHVDYIDKHSELAGLSAADYEYRCYLQNMLNKSFVKTKLSDRNELKKEIC
jgi:hypothetical protein